MSTRRAVITGVGFVTPIGTGVEAFWRAALDGINGIRPITGIDTAEFKTKVGGEVRDFNGAEYLAADEIAHMGLSSQYAIAAATMALHDAGLDIGGEDPWRIAVSAGTTMGEPQILEQGIETKYRSGARDIPATLPRQYPCNAIPTNIAHHFGTKGPVIIIPTACAAGNYSLGYASDLIKLGRADCVLAGGSDPFSKIAFTGFNRLLATAEKACRPFAKNRDGMAVSEGAGMLVVEDLERAKRRGARIYAEILGYGLSCDAYKMTIPDPSGSGGIRALRRALDNARVAPQHVDYVCAHGTGTVENDKTETLIMKEVLGERAYTVPISSLKSMIGHTMGAASAIEAAACALMIHHGVLLPTINYEEPDPECDLDYVPNAPREAAVEIVVSNAYAFGGNTSSIVLGKCR
jgi:3-oxoacyl-[acyl-carrier-protein] synthase II